MMRCFLWEGGDEGGKVKIVKAYFEMFKEVIITEKTI